MPSVSVGTTTHQVRSHSSARVSRLRFAAMARTAYRLLRDLQRLADHRPLRRSGLVQAAHRRGVGGAAGELGIGGGLA